MTLESVNETCDTYPAWPYSPVPHLAEQIIIFIFVVFLAALAYSMYKVQKKKSSTAMDQTTIELIKREVEEEERERLEEAKELQKKVDEGVDLSDDWEVIGIHRQLGGFLYTLFISLFLILPQLIISSFILPQIIQPYPQAAGMYNFAFNLFAIAWLVFDMGTSFALAKYFAQYRVKDPEKAIHYIQIFVWWQLFTGLVQITIFAFIGSLVFPYTGLAHMSWVFITYSLIQYPGFFLVFMYTFQGMQKADKYLIAYVCFEAVFLLIGQIVFCAIGRMIGAAFPVIGEALGAGIGYSIARLFDHWISFFYTMRMFKKMGYSTKTVFRIDFTKEEFKEAMSYGWKMAFGSSFVQIGWFIQVLITSAFIANYTNELGYYNLAANIAALIQLIALYGSSLVGAFSESHSHDKKVLTKLYIYQGFRWANYFGYFLVSVLFAIGAKFIIGAAGEEYGTPALKFLVPLLIFHTLGIYSWLVDAIFVGTGHTGLAAKVWIIEQTVRSVLMIIFVIWLRNYVAVILAYIPAVLIKGIISWILVRYKITDYKLYPFKTFVTPALAAIVNGIVLFFIGELIWAVPMGDKIVNTMIIFLVGIFVFIYFFSFIEGFFGGYDENTLKEFERATILVKGRIGKLPKLLYKSARAGSKISPFYNKFKIDIYEVAMKEAYDLTLEKRQLVI